MDKKANLNKKSLKRQKVDIYRSLRVVKYIDFTYILENSPVEITEGYIVSDRETCEVFASFIFKNISTRTISSLSIRLSLYLNQNIPYKTVDFVYSHKDLTFGIINSKKKDLKLKESNKKQKIETGESFGSCVFVPIPETYFSKLEVTLLSVVYTNGVTEEINQVVSGNRKLYKELDYASKKVYERINIYQSAESRHPTVVIPQFNENVWLCCCGTKNSSVNKVCDKCGREMKFQKDTLSEHVFAETVRETVSNPTEISLHDKTRFAQNKYLENDAEIKKKIEDYEKAMRNVELQEQRKQRNLWTIWLKVLIWILVMTALPTVFEFIFELIF